MAGTPIDFETFLALAKRAGLPLTPHQARELHASFHHIEAMTERLRGRGNRAPGAEPAITFDPRKAAP